MLMTHQLAPVIIDCDPGSDDFFALLRAMSLHKQGIFDIVGVTTSGGNVAAQCTYENAQRAAAIA